MTQTLPVPRVRISAEHRRAYLEALAATGSHSAACKAAAVSRRTMAAHVAANDDFAEDVAEAKAAFADKLLATARKLGVEGVEVPIFHAGQVVGSRREISERILLKLLEKIGPDEFRAPDKIVHEHKHTGEVRLVAPEILAAMAPAARIEAQRVMLLADMRDKPDSEKQSAVLALSQEASRLGVDFDTLGTARALRIGKLAEPIEADYVEVPSDDIAQQLRELEELL